MKYSVYNLNHNIPYFYGHTVHRKKKKKKNFRYTKIDNQKGELQANLRIKTELQKWTHSS